MIESSEWARAIIEEYYLNLQYFPELYQYGILPKTVKGLRGIPLHIFIHGNFKHLLNNSIPIFFLVMALKYFYRQQFFKVLFLGILLFKYCWIKFKARLAKNSFFSFLFFRVGLSMASGLVFTMPQLEFIGWKFSGSALEM